MGEALVSVIVPVYNGATHIRRCIEKLLTQTHKNIEIIIIDDGSTDGTRKVCEDFIKEKKEERVKYYYQDNKGVSSARNKGIELANGRYISFVDVDDYLEDKAIEQCLLRMEDHKLDMLIFGYYFDIPSDGKSNVEHIPNSYKNILFENIDHFKESLVDLYDENLMYNIWNKMYRKEFINEHCIRFPVGKVYNEDRDFVRDCVRHVERVEVISNCFYHYNRDDSSTTGIYRKELFAIRKEEYERLYSFFTEIGLDDEKTKEYVSRQHLDRIMGCVENLFHISSGKLSGKEKKYIKNSIRKIINDEITIDSVKNTVPKSNKMKVMMIPYKMRSVNGVYAMTSMIYLIHKNYPQLFHKLKQSR